MLHTLVWSLLVSVPADLLVIDRIFIIQKHHPSGPQRSKVGVGGGGEGGWGGGEGGWGG